MRSTAFYLAYMVIPMDHPRALSRRRLWHFLACAFLFCVAVFFLRLGNKGFNVPRFLRSSVSPLDMNTEFSSHTVTMLMPTHSP